MSCASSESAADRCAWIFGATGVVGRATARRLIDDGWRVLLSARDAAALERIAAELGAGPGRVLCLPGDLTSAAWTAQALEEATPWIGAAGLGGLVFSAASSPDERRGTWTVGEEAFLAHWRLKCGGPVRIVEQVLGLLEAARGSVVLLGGTDREILAQTYVSTMANACTSFAATYIGRELAPLGVRVNVVSPGPIEMENGRTNTTIPAGRRAAVEEVVAAIAFLLSAEAGFITATNLVVDGGLSVAVF
jgi:NAD(P)-dependent dehydrogenase (short-subunit alcohol dehydrogenase family)